MARRSSRRSGNREKRVSAGLSQIPWQRVSNPNPPLEILTADQIANMIKQAVANQQFFLLPHKSGRRAYFFKRFVPAIFNRMMLKGAEGLRRKLEKAENA